MHALALLVATASLGVDYGWKPTEDGQLEYIIQIEPSLVELLRQGQEIVSEIHPDAKDVRRFRIFVGKGALPREGLPEVAPALEAEPEPEMPLRRPVSRGPRDVAHTQFQPAIEPGPVAEEPEDLSPPASRRRFGGDFVAPDAPSNDTRLGPLQPEPWEPDASESALNHRPVKYDERLASRKKLSNTMPAKVGLAQELFTATEPAKAEEPKPWFPLFVTVVLLFGSIGGNAYLALMARDFYSRYRALAAELREPRAVDG